MYSKLIRVSQSAQRLPLEQRQVFEAMFFDGDSEDQICKRLSIPLAELQRRITEMARSLRAAAQ